METKGRDMEASRKRFSNREQARIVTRMTREAERVRRHIGADACVVIGVFNDQGQLRIQDAGMFPMPPEQFYELVKQAHVNGQLALNVAPQVAPIRNDQ